MITMLYHLKCLSKETTNLDTLELGGMVLANVGNLSLLETCMSGHF